MANNGTAETTDERVISPTVKECLTPLLATRDQILSEENELKEEIKSKRDLLYQKGDERKEIEKVLRAAGMIASEPTPDSDANEPSTKGSPIAAQAPAPARTKASQEAQDRVRKVIEGMEGEPFQVAMIEKRGGGSRGTVERVIGYMRGENRLRLLGKQPALERKDGSSGGAPAMTFQEIV